MTAAARAAPDAEPRPHELFAANAILDRRSADPDDDPAIVARAYLRLASHALAPDAEHEALRDRMLAMAHVYLAAVATGSPEAYQRECWQALVEARDALDAYLDAHPALLAKYEALWGTIEATDAS